MDPYPDFTGLSLFTTSELAELRKRLEERVAAAAACAAKPR